MNQDQPVQEEKPNAVLKATVTLQLAEMIKRVAEKHGVKVDDEEKKS